MIAGLFEVPASLLAWFYKLTNNYILAISMIALVIMVITAPLVLKSTKGMLEMQKLAPEMKRLQNEHRNDRQTLNEEMMKLYQAHKVNPLASCFPLLLQMPVFFIMFRVLHGLTDKVSGRDGFPGFTPKYIATGSKMYTDLKGKSEMLSWGLDLAKRPSGALSESIGKGLPYALLIIVLGALYFAQQKMTAARATVSPTMSQNQQKLMLYLPVVFALFLFFYLTGLVVYYMAQAVFRIALQAYITRRFYKGEHSLGRQAQAASDRAREIPGKDGTTGGGGIFSQARRELADAKKPASRPAGKAGTAKSASIADARSPKAITAPKDKPTPSARTGRPAPSGRAGRPGAQRPTKKK